MWLLIVVAIIVGIGVFISLILAIPFDADIVLDVHGKPRVKAGMKWFFGFVSFEPGEKPARARKKVIKPKKKTGFRSTGLQFGTVLDVLRIQGLLDELKKLIIRLFRCLDVRKFEGEFEIGLFDPADTGFLFGIIAAVTVPFGHPLTGNFRLHSSFERPMLEGDVHAIVRVQPIYVIAPIGLFIFSPPVLKAVRIVITTQWRKRRSQSKVPSPSMA